MTSDLATLESVNQQLCQTVADLQRAMDELQQKQALLAHALLNAARGRWEAAQFGAQSVESFLVAFDPALHGKVQPRPCAVAH